MPDLFFEVAYLFCCLFDVACLLVLVAELSLEIRDLLLQYSQLLAIHREFGFFGADLKLFLVVAILLLAALVI